MDALTQKLIDRAWNADRLRKQNASIKRTVSSIRNQARDLDALLDDDEREALFAAARVLDRWTGKAERAFTAKNQAEKAEAKRQATRATQARKAIMARYAGDDLAQQIRHACAIAGSESYLPALPTRLREEMQALLSDKRPLLRVDPGSRFGREFRREFDQAVQLIVDAIAYRTDPLADLLAQAYRRIDQSVATNRVEVDRLIVEVQAFLVRVQIERANAVPQSE
ncbi:MAG: hypothetical protein WBN00_15695 [Sedimenticolaceae bacterium]